MVIRFGLPIHGRETGDQEDKEIEKKGLATRGGNPRQSRLARREKDCLTTDSDIKNI